MVCTIIYVFSFSPCTAVHCHAQATALPRAMVHRRQRRTTKRLAVAPHQRTVQDHSRPRHTAPQRHRPSATARCRRSTAGTHPLAVLVAISPSRCQWRRRGRGLVSRWTVLWRQLQPRRTATACCLPCRCADVRYPSYRQVWPLVLERGSLCVGRPRSLNTTACFPLRTPFCPRR